MADAELEMFKKMLRSVLIPNKDGVATRAIENEYRSLVQSDIPYRKFGFNSCRDFMLKKVPDAVRLTTNKFGEEVYVAIGTEETKHIEKLVKCQKTSKKAKKKHTTHKYLGPGHRNAAHAVCRQPRPKASHGGTTTSFSHPKPQFTGNFGNAPVSFRPHAANFASSALKVKGSFGAPGAAFPSSQANVPFGTPGGAFSSSKAKPFFSAFGGASLSSKSKLPSNVFGSASSFSKAKFPPSASTSMSSAPRSYHAESSTPLPAMESKSHVNPTTASLVYKRELPPRLQKFARLSPSTPGFESYHPGDGNSAFSGASASKPFTPEPVAANPSVGRRSVFSRLGSVPGTCDTIIDVPSGATQRKAFESKRSVSVTALPNESPDLYRTSAEETERKFVPSSPLNRSFNKDNNNTDLEVDIEKLRSEILKLLEMYNCGVWLGSLKSVYETTFQQKAPANLENLVETWTDIILVDKTGFKTIVKAQNLSSWIMKKPDLLDLKNEWERDVYVSFVKNSSEFCVRILGEQHSILLENLEERLLRTNLQTIDFVREGLVCVVMNDIETEYESMGEITRGTEKSYYRVEVTKVSHHTVEVEYIDHGGREEVDLKQLFYLPAFADLPCQAIWCVLEGLEKHATDRAVSDMLQKDLIERTCFAKGKRLNDKDNVFSVILYENDTLQDNINESFEVFTCQPRIPSCLFEASVSNVTYSGLVYFHIDERGLARINRLLNNSDLFELGTRYDIPRDRSQLESLPLAAVKVSNQWRRAKVVEIVSDTKVQVQYLDYGEAQVVSVSDLMSLSPTTHMTIVEFPTQALCCHIKGLPTRADDWSVDAYLHLSTIMIPKGTKVWLNVVENAESGLAVAEMQLGSDRSSVAELMNASDKIWVKLMPSKVRPPVSAEEVYITDCQDPRNFKGFPLVFFRELNELMSDLYQFYSKNTTVELVPSYNSLHEGFVCAVQRSADAPWQRAVITRIISRNLIGVRLVDYGQTVVVQSIAQLRRLPSSFLLLPFLSIDMAMAGVIHDGVSWSETDADQLRTLILNKTFQIFVPKNVLVKDPLSVTLVNPRVCENPFMHQVLLQKHLVTSINNPNL